MSHLYTYACTDMILYLKIYETVFFLGQCCRLYLTLYLFLPTIHLKLFHFLQVGFFLQLISWKFPLFCLTQTNLLQHFIIFSIRKRQVQKPKLGLTSFHIYGIMTTFGGLMKKTGNAYDVIKVYNESMLLSILLTYWGRRLCILKVVMLLSKNLI